MSIIDKVKHSTNENVDSSNLKKAAPVIILIAGSVIGFGIVKTLTRSSDRFIDAVISTEETT